MRARIAAIPPAKPIPDPTALPVAAFFVADAVVEVDDMDMDVDVVEVAFVQTTASGTVTPAVAQIDLAYATAAVWSEALQAPVRQHAMPLRKPALLHIQPMLRDGQPAMPSPVVYFVTHGCYRSEMVSRGQFNSTTWSL